MIPDVTLQLTHYAGASELSLISSLRSDPDQSVETIAGLRFLLLMRLLVPTSYNANLK